MHQGTICMEKTVDRIIAEFPLSSCCGVYSVIEILFIAIVPDGSLRQKKKVLRLQVFKGGDNSKNTLSVQAAVIIFTTEVNNAKIAR